MDRPGHETDKGAVTAMTVMPTPDFGPREGPGLTPRRLLPQTPAFRPPTSKPDRAAADPGVAATVRLLHRRHGWNWEALPASWRSFWPTAPVLMRSSRGSAPSWFLDMIIVLAR
jgi:hypothetical protein